MRHRGPVRLKVDTKGVIMYEYEHERKECLLLHGKRNELSTGGHHIKQTYWTARAGEVI